MHLLRLNRSRDCRCCNTRRFRVLVVWPKPTDPDYTGALCPTCDMTVGKASDIERWGK